MIIRTFLFSAILLTALAEFTPALVYAGGGVLFAEGEFYQVIGLSHLAGLFGLTIS